MFYQCVVVGLSKLSAILVAFLVAVSVGRGEPVIVTFESGKIPESIHSRSVEAIDGGVELRKEDGARGYVAEVSTSIDGKERGLILVADVGDILYEELSSFSIALWVRADPTPRTMVFFQRLSGSRTRPGFFAFYNQSNIEASGTQRGSFRFTGTGPDGVPQTVASDVLWTLSPNEWNHLAMTFDKGIVRFFLNGIPLGGQREFPMPIIPALASPFNSLKIGSGFRGALDDVAFFPDRVLSDQEIQILTHEGPQSLTQLSRK